MKIRTKDTSKGSAKMGISIRLRQFAAAGLSFHALMATASTPARPPSAGAPPVRIVVIGDSLSTGCGTSPPLAWPALLSADTRSKGNINIVNAAENGSGYLSQGDFHGTFGTGQQLRNGRYRYRHLIRLRK